MIMETKTLKDLIEMGAASSKEIKPYVKSGGKSVRNDFLEMWGYTNIIDTEENVWEYLPEDGLWFLKQ
jgi:hypothetical protein